MHKSEIFCLVSVWLSLSDHHRGCPDEPQSLSSLPGKMTILDIYCCYFIFFKILNNFPFIDYGKVELKEVVIVPHCKVNASMTLLLSPPS